MRASYDFICSIGELIDKLSIENIKCYHANNRIQSIRAVGGDPIEIAKLEADAREAGEQRVRLRHEINLRLKDAIERGTIGAARDVRTYK